MRRAVMALAASVAALTASLPAMAQDLPAAEARAEDPFRTLYPLIGRTWRGTGSGPMPSRTSCDGNGPSVVMRCVRSTP